MVCAASVALLLGLYIAKINFSTLAKHFITVQSQSDQTNPEILRLNTRISQINAAQQEFTPWSNILTTITGLTPSDVIWETWTFDKQENTARLTGTAGSQDNLAQMQEALWREPWIAQVDSTLEEPDATQDQPLALTLTLVFKKLSS